MGYPLQYSWASLVPQMVKNSPAMRETGHFFSRGSGFFRFSSMILLPKRVNFFFLWQLQQLYAQYCICDGFMCRAAKKSCPHSLLACAPSFKSPAKDSPSASISSTLRQLCFETQQLLFVKRSFYQALIPNFALETKPWYTYHEKANKSSIFYIFFQLLFNKKLIFIIPIK